MLKKMVSVRIEKEIIEYLKERADNEHRTLSNMINAILYDDKVKNGRPSVKVGDTVKWENKQGVITDINESGTWTIVHEDGKKGEIFAKSQHNWKKV